ncbi:sortase [Clavibacter zhangzhiyongii]|uniref:sortase n=1 Tax=Clavibacter zhangzhiyongii TaxID=2768071 RepID=UPI0039E01AB4
MRPHRDPGTIAAAALCLALVAATPAVAAVAPAEAVTRPSVAAPAAAAPALEVQELTGPEIPLDDLAPGDTVDWAAQVTNVSSDGSPLAVRIDAATSMALTGDPSGGLQLAVRLCEGGFASLAAPMRCRGAVEPLGSGPAATLDGVVTSTPLEPGETVGVAVRVRFPAEADNRMESTDGRLRISFALTDDAGAVPVPGVDAPGGGSVAPAASAPSADAPHDLLPVTGRDIASAVVGALLALLGGGILLLASRRRRRDPGTAS